MTERERVLAAIEHRPVDRAPVDYLAKGNVTPRLMERLGVHSEEELLQALEVDMRRISHAKLCPPPTLEEDGFVRSRFGVRTKQNTSNIAMETIYPFQDGATLDDIHAHNWPDPAALDYSGIRKMCAQFHGRHATYGSPWCPFFHEVGWMIGEENLLAWMLVQPQLVHALVDHVVAYYLEVTRLYLDACGGMLDIAYFGNDYGTQASLLMSPAQWQEFFRGPQKAFFDLAHDYGCRVMFHSCGSIHALIPSLIADGVDILDPVQARASGMYLPDLVAEFGGQLAFHGGVDVQQTLPFGTPEEVRAECRAYTSLGREQGGYILMACQNLTDDVPTENLLALYDLAVR